MTVKEPWKDNGFYNGNSNFTADNIREIRARVRNGQSRLEVADLFGVAKVTIDKIVTGQTFRNVPDVAPAPMAGVKAAQEELLAALAKDGIFPADESKPQAKPEPGRLAFMEEGGK